MCHLSILLDLSQMFSALLLSSDGEQRLPNIYIINEMYLLSYSIDDEL